MTGIDNRPQLKRPDGVMVKCQNILERLVMVQDKLSSIRAIISGSNNQNPPPEIKIGAPVPPEPCINEVLGVIDNILDRVESTSTSIRDLL